MFIEVSEALNLKCNLLFSYCLGIVRPGILFPITVEKFDLETALVINQYVCGRN
jgi:hypothetical protein